MFEKDAVRDSFNELIQFLHDKVYYFLWLNGLFMC